MINARKAFKVLRDDEKRAVFDQDLLGVIDPPILRLWPL